MKTERTWKADTKALFAAAIAAGLLALSAGAAVAQGTPAASNKAIEHCGCDDPAGIKMYVSNLVNDARLRGLTTETAKMHSSACIAVWCTSFCAGHPDPGTVERCVTRAAAQLDSAVASLNARQSAGQPMLAAQ